MPKMDLIFDDALLEELASLTAFPTFAAFANIFSSFVKGLMRRAVDPAAARAVSPLAELNSASASTYAVLHLGTLWIQASRPDFEIRPVLANMLKDTDIPEIDSALLRLPFEGVKLLVPRGTFEKFPEVDEIFVGYAPGDRFRIVFSEAEGRGTFMNIDPTLPTVADGVAQSRDTSKHMFADEFYAFDDVYAVFKFAVNAALYITSEKADVREDRTHVHRIHGKLQGLRKKEKRAQLERDLQRAKKHRIFIAGEGLALPPEYTVSLTEEGKRAALSYRFRVRGHFRDQPFGEGRKERRQIFVAPYWKGPSLAEMLERHYVLGPNRESGGSGDGGGSAGL